MSTPRSNSGSTSAESCILGAPMRRITTTLGALAIVTAASNAPAQDVAAAEALFNKGLADMEAGKLDTGCPALAESYRLDPRLGTLFTVAECRARAGAIATAVTLFEDYLSAYGRLTPGEQAKQKGRNKLATARKAELEPQVPKLTIRLEAGAPSDAEVKRDDVVLKGPSLGVALPVDPGEHTLTTQLPGGPLHEQKVTIAKGEAKEVSLPVLPVPAAKPESPPPATRPPPGPPPPEGGMSPLKIVGIAAGAVGVAGLAVGGITGGLTLGEKGTVDDNCVELRCNADGFAAVEQGRTLALVSTIGFAAGGGLLAAGVILFLVAPDPEPSTTGSITPLFAVDPAARAAFTGLGGRW